MQCEHWSVKIEHDRTVAAQLLGYFESGQREKACLFSKEWPKTLILLVDWLVFVILPPLQQKCSAGSTY